MVDMQLNVIAVTNAAPIAVPPVNLPFEDFPLPCLSTMLIGPRAILFKQGLITLTIQIGLLFGVILSLLVARATE
jgi:hypothetical protein